MSHHHHHHHHQPLHLNFSGVKTAFIAAGRDRRRGGRGRAAGGHVFSSNISLAITNHAHAHASILARSVGARSSPFRRESRLQRISVGQQLKTQSALPSLLSLQFESTLTVRFPPRARGNK